MFQTCVEHWTNASKCTSGKCVFFRKSHTKGAYGGGGVHIMSVTRLRHRHRNVCDKTQKWIQSSSTGTVYHWWFLLIYIIYKSFGEMQPFWGARHWYAQERLPAFAKNDSYLMNIKKTKRKGVREDRGRGREKWLGRKQAFWLENIFTNFQSANCATRCY